MGDLDLVDQFGITGAVDRYAALMDRRRWDEYATLFGDMLAIDFPTWTAGDLQARQSRDQWVETVRRALSGFATTQHVLTSPIVSRQGHCATVEVHMSARHVYEPGRSHTLGGFYTFSLKRFDQAWKIDGITLDATWDEGDRSLWQQAYTRFCSAGEQKVTHG